MNPDGIARWIVRKPDYTFVPYDKSPAVQLTGVWKHIQGQAISVEALASVRIRLRDCAAAYGVFTRHDWSGKMAVLVNGEERDCFDLYSPVHYQTCLPLLPDVASGAVRLELRVAGKNLLSNASEMVFLGLLLPRDAGPAQGSPAHEPGPPACHELSGGECAVGPSGTAPPAGESPEAFRKMQSGMVDRYVQGVLDRGVSLEEESAERFRRYAMRFKELLIHVEPASRVLDLGAGFLTRDFVRRHISPSRLRYWAQDIDPRVAEYLEPLFREANLYDSNIRLAPNTELDYPDGHFDAVYSSHCLEHSSDLMTTFSGIHRVLKPGGCLFYSVPFGYDDSLEHTYAIDVEGWLALTAMHGFDIQSYTIGKIYSPARHDLTIVAVKKH